jgi:hypothetical protein
MPTLVYLIAAGLFRAHAAIARDIDLQACLCVSLLGLTTTLAVLRLEGPASIILLASLG